MESAVKCKLILYAYDSALLVSEKDIKVTQETLGKELCALSSWLVDNKLSTFFTSGENRIYLIWIMQENLQLIIVRY